MWCLAGAKKEYSGTRRQVRYTFHILQNEHLIWIVPEVYGAESLNETPYLPPETLRQAPSETSFPPLPEVPRRFGVANPEQRTGKEAPEECLSKHFNILLEKG